MRWAGLALAAEFVLLAWAVGWQAGKYAEARHSPPLTPSQPVATAAGPAAQVTALRTPQPVAFAPPRKVVTALGAVEVCGFGVVQVPPDDPDPVQRIPLAMRQSALDAMDALMLASDDTRVRAAALWMGARIRGREVRDRIEQMARLASASQDPYVYAMALEACQGLSPDDSGSCSLLSRAQWARLDPYNAVPWQALAGEAHAREEPQLEQAALQLAAQARHSDVHAGWLPRLVDKALGAQAEPLQRTLGLSAGWSAEAVWAASHGLEWDAANAASAQGFDLSCDSVSRMQTRMSRPRRVLLPGPPGQDEAGGGRR